jgi:hypothetical protein
MRKNHPEGRVTGGAQDVQAVARRYFDTKNYVQMVLNPELHTKATSVAQIGAPATPAADERRHRITRMAN